MGNLTGNPTLSESLADYFKETVPTATVMS